MFIPLRNTAHTYGLVSQLLHWLVALLVILQFTWAWRIQQLDPFTRARFDLVNEHKSIGATLLALVGARLLWRLFNPPPPPPPTLAAWEQRAAATAHWLLYAVLVALPLTGWMMSSAAGYGVQWFGLFRLPDLVAQDQALLDRMQALHALLATALAGLVSVHVLAALRHELWKRDNVLRRMLPLWRRDR